MQKIWIALALLILGGIGVGFFLYHKPHQNIKRAKADFQMESTALFAAFEENEETANNQYLDKLIEVTGTVSDINTDEEGLISITLDGGGLMFGVICQLDEWTEHPETAFQTGETVTFKGLCTGMLMDVVLVRCVQTK